MNLVILFFFACATILLAIKRFSWAIGLLIIALPTYLLRLQVGPLPSTLLEVLFGSIFLVWLIRYAKEDSRNIGKAVQARPYFFAAVGIFFCASLLGVAVSDMVLLSFGQWRAYFLEPILLFFMLLGRCNTPTAPLEGEARVRQLIWPLVISTLSISVYAVVQKFTGFGIATPEWTAAATRRVTAFYTSPNAVALYLAPLVFLGVAFAIKLYKENKQQAAGVVAVIVFVSLAAIAFTFSQGAWIALAIGFVVFIGLVGYKKSAVTLGILGAVLACLILFFPNSLPVHYKSAGNRVLLWGYSQEFLTTSPKNFILGAGVRQFFRKIQKPHYDVKVLERLIYPHNIFLNFWTEIGFFGMLSFIFIFVYISRISYRVYRHADRVLGAGLIVMLLVFFIHGLIDVPYFKNDLAMLWWVMTALVIASQAKQAPGLR